jgi:hypothetical protein
MFKRFQNRDYATKEGYLARLTGSPIEKNPYPENSQNWKDWKAAWHYADHLVVENRNMEG